MPRTRLFVSFAGRTRRVAGRSRGVAGRLRGVAGLAVCVAGLLGCGTLGEGDTGATPSGAANLPNRGIVPYEPVSFLRGTRLSPWLYPPPLTPDLPAVRDPSAWVLDPDADETAGVALFAQVTSTEGAFIGRADSEDGLAFEAFVPVLAPTPADATAPAVFRDPDTGRWHLVFATAAGLAHATSAEGTNFAPDASVWLTAEGADEAGGIGSPSLVIDAGVAHLFYAARAGVAPVAPASGPSGPELPASPVARPSAPPVVVRHTAGRLTDAGVRFGPRRTVLRPGVDCTDPQGKPFPCWNKDSVGDPEVRLATTAAGRRVWRMFFTGARGELAAVGFAAAFEPDAEFEPYAFNPVIADRQKSRAAPTNVRLGDGYLLYFTQPALKPAVGVAENASGAASERF